MPAPPSNVIQEYIQSPATRVTRRVDIYEEDGDTPWMLNAPLKAGSVSVDSTREERRSIDCTFDNTDGLLKSYPGGFWYDKVIKAFRGVSHPVYGTWEIQIGEFIIDGVDSPNFPHHVHVVGRDYTAKLLTSKFTYPTTFVLGEPVENVIKTIAINGQIPAAKIIAPLTGKTLGRDFAFERGVERWTAMKEIASSYNYELYFDNSGYLVMREFLDPVTSPLAFTFQTGEDGNLVTYEKRQSPARIYNVVVVAGEATDTIPVAYVAKNTEPSSPTSIANLGQERVYQYTSAFITTQAQAQSIAESFLAIHALEQFDLSISSLVIPWLEAGEIVEFVDPDPSPGDPSRYLLSDFTLPLNLGAMTATGKRVTVVS